MRSSRTEQDPIPRSLILASVASVMLSSTLAAEPSPNDENGTIHVPAFTLPESALLRPETRAIYQKSREPDNQVAVIPDPCPSDRNVDVSQMSAIRQCQIDALYASSYYKHLREQYAVDLVPTRIGGVNTEVFLPKEGIAPRNRARVLINLHGGGFLGGSRTISHIESIPIREGHLKLSHLWTSQLSHPFGKTTLIAGGPTLHRTKLKAKAS